MSVYVASPDRVGASVKKKQEVLYQLCHDYLIDNFHKFTDANKLKVSLAISIKMAPSNNYNDNIGSGETNINIIRAENKDTIQITRPLGDRFNVPVNS